jgi:aconitate hydratase
MLLERPGAVQRAGQNGTRAAALPRLPAIATTLRGVVLVRLGDRVTADQILSSGPRVRRHRMDIPALAAHLYSGVDRDFATRARAHGGGFVLAGSDYGAGPGDPYAALAMAELRVRAVVARSFAPGARQELIRNGILALRFAPDSDPAGFDAGDELEIPGLPEVLEPNRPVALRDLTHGGQITLHHDMTAREIEMARAGGLLAVTRGIGAGAS